MKVIEHMEKITTAWRPEGDWIAKLDLVEQGDRLVVKEMDQVGGAQPSLEWYHSPIAAPRRLSIPVLHPSCRSAAAAWSARLLRRLLSASWGNTTPTWQRSCTRSVASALCPWAAVGLCGHVA